MDRNEIAKLAQEVLRLEREIAKPNPKKSDRESWDVALQKLLHSMKTEEYGYANLRLSVVVEGVMRKGPESFAGRIINVSLGGLGLVGDGGKFAIGDQVKVTLTPEEKKDIHILLNCEVKWLRKMRQGFGTEVGLQLAVDNTAEDKKKFFDHVYYPAYIDFLELLASGDVA